MPIVDTQVIAAMAPPAEHEVRAIVRRALEEDMPWGDVTTEALVPPETQALGQIVVREAGTVCGLGVAAMVFAELDPSLRFEACLADGERVRPGTVAAEIRGAARPLLRGERTALNLMQRMSGIATATARYVEAIEGTSARIVDTRKTAPGLRVLDKYAVRCGGGSNHRFSLSDGVLVKDNHLAALMSFDEGDRQRRGVSPHPPAPDPTHKGWGYRGQGRGGEPGGVPSYGSKVLQAAGDPESGLAAALRAARRAVPHTVRVEVEVDRLEQIGAALDGGADIILLDNMDPSTMREAVDLIAGRALSEASGGITLETVRDVARTGVDLISIGALTHSVRALDISLDLSVLGSSATESGR